ncbi:MAG: TetR/AcrR family transcriptional regulator [Akkermansiaceae bacterium]|nr:TetR/AcrR family transcriptional regulator [Armatimonadota bacterium]
MNEPFQEQVAHLRRTQILTAAVTVFAARGFHRATIRDVAKAAGVADGTIYNYFPNKAALLLGILDPHNESEGRSDPAPPPPDAVDADAREFFRHLFRLRWSLLAGDKLSVLRVVLSEVLVNPELRTLYVERVIAPTFALAAPHLERLIAAGRLRPLDVPLTLRTMTATFLGLVTLRFMGDQHLQDQWDDVPELLTTLLLDGMLPRGSAAPSGEGDSHGTV